MAVLLLGTACVCFAAMLPGMPYSYFMLVRVVTCAVMTVMASRLFDQRREPWAWGCVAVAILFNPVFKVHLTRDLWWFLDGGAAVWCLALVNAMGRE